MLCHAISEKSDVMLLVDCCKHQAILDNDSLDITCHAQPVMRMQTGLKLATL